MPGTIKFVIFQFIKVLTLTTSIAALVACSGFFRPHRMPIQQGNIVTKEMLDKLKVGMTTKQVRYVLGTPLLVDTFANDAWHYLYSLRLPDGRTLQQKLSLDFSAGTLASINSDYEFGEMPSGKPAGDVQPSQAQAPTAGLGGNAVESPGDDNTE